MLIKYILIYGAPKKLYGSEIDKIEEISRKAASAGLKLIPSKIRHLGAEKCALILTKIKKDLEKKLKLDLIRKLKI
jgi:uncharacterized FAD-dependent dehydrogenase